MNSPCMSGTTIDRGREADSGLLSSVAHPKQFNYSMFSGARRLPRA